MNNQRVSVVITTYLRDDMLAGSLQSLAAQTLPLHEVLVVDDGGSGSAREIVTQFGERFRYLWQPNSGQQSARNLGARSSTGDWIAFLDDDDLWLSERHTRLAELMATGQVDLISGDFTKFGENWIAPTGVFYEIEQKSPGFWDGIPHEPGTNYSIVGKFPTTRLFPVYPFWPSTLVIRRDLFERINGWNTKLRGIKSEDNEFGFRAIKNGELGIIWPPTVHYRCHMGNDSNFPLLNAIGRTQVWEEMRQSLELTDNERRALNIAIDQTRHSIIWSAFNEKKHAIVVETARKMTSLNLSITERTKIFISKMIAGSG